VNEGDLKSARTISRKDVGHFVVEGVLAKWDEESSWKGKCVSVAY
jgi:hypothetical protein